VLRHHAREGNGVAVALEVHVIVGLGRHQDLLEEGLLVVAARWWGDVLLGWGGRWRRVGPVGPFQTRVDAMRRQLEMPLLHAVYGESDGATTSYDF
jgi:hypothetical protein